MPSELELKIKTVIDGVESLKQRNPVNFDSLVLEVQGQLKLSELTLLNETYLNTEKHHEYISKLFKFRRIVNTLEQTGYVLYRLLYQYYTEETDRVLRTREDKERYIHSDAHYITLQNVVSEYKMIVEYLEKVDRLFAERGYAISTAARIIGGG